MESSIQNETLDHFPIEPERPQALKILCILSFIGCGLMLLVYGLGTMTLGLDAETIATFWDKVLEKNPQLEETDPVQFFHDFGMICVYGIIATIFSLIGVIMMWRLEKIGFFIYAIAELATHFFSLNMSGTQEKGYGGTIFMVFVDLVFIILYFVHLKYMSKKNNNTFIQSGS